MISSVGFLIKAQADENQGSNQSSHTLEPAHSIQPPFAISNHIRRQNANNMLPFLIDIDSLVVLFRKKIWYFISYRGVQGRSQSNR
jgi:hypothetical protein